MSDDKYMGEITTPRVQVGWRNVKTQELKLIYAHMDEEDPGDDWEPVYNYISRPTLS